MIETLFRRTSLLIRLQEGPFGPYLEELSTELQQQGYSTHTIRVSLQAADRFTRWLVQQKLTLSDAHKDNQARFLASLGRCPAGGWPSGVQGLHHAIGLLQRKGIVRPPEEFALTSPVEQWLVRFEYYLAHTVGAALHTRQRYGPIVQRFLTGRFGNREPEWLTLQADDLTAFVRQEAIRLQGYGRKVPAVALRAFLRFLVGEGVIRDGLAAAVPTLRQWQHAHLPLPLTAEQVTAVLATCAKHTATDLRDRAILLLLVRLGLRASEVVQLQLDDLDWRASSLRLRVGKTRQERVLPLLAEVGTTLTDYLQHGRPHTTSCQVFLHSAPPHRPFQGASAVSQIAHRRLVRAGVPAQPGLGAHRFRHTIASQMVCVGASFKEVADVLGHHSLQTTGIYAKLNLPALSQVALPWNGGAQ
jgi:site-specific recombinase XerD